MAMGNTRNRNNAPLKHRCQFDFECPSTVRAGDDLRGAVIVRALEELPPTDLTLRLTGKERAEVRHSNGERVRAARDERRLCAATVVLRRRDGWDGGAIAPGTYAFPFVVPLPATLPRSARLSRDGGECEIAYKLEVDATPGEGPTVRGAVERTFRVESLPLPDVRVPATADPSWFRVNSHCGLVDRGEIAIAARVADVEVGRGDDIEIFLATRNFATASIYRVEISLVERASWKAEGRAGACSATHNLLDDVDVPGIHRGKQDKETARELMSEDVHWNELAYMYREELYSERNRVVVRVPACCNDSYVSDMIKIAHQLKIKAHTRFNVSNPVVTIPLRIGSPPSMEPNDASSPTANDFDGETSAAPGGGEGPVEVGAPAPSVSCDLHDAAAFPAASAPTLETMIAVPVPVPVPVAPTTDAATSPTAESIEVLLSEDSLRAPLITAPSEAIVVGGATPSILNLESLLEEMLHSVDDYDILRAKCDDASWASTLAGLSPGELGGILAHVHNDTDQPRVVALLAVRAMEGRFTCAHGEEAVRNSAEWNRAAMVRAVLPHCVDMVNCGRIRDILSHWDRIVTQEDFDKAAAPGALC